MHLSGGDAWNVNLKREGEINWSINQKQINCVHDHPPTKNWNIVLIAKQSRFVYEEMV